MSNEVKRFSPEYCEAGGVGWAEMQEDAEGAWCKASDYDALAAEFKELAERYAKLQTGEDGLVSRVVAERDAALAELAAICAAGGAVDKHEAQPEVAENTGSHAMATNQLQRQEQAVDRDVEGVAAPCEASLVNDIFAWATFDGEGSYDLRLFEENESYRDDFRRNNPKHHPDWVFPLYRHSIVAAMAAELERAKEEVTRWHTLACNHSRAEDRLRAELEAARKQEPVAWVAKGNITELKRAKEPTWVPAWNKDRHGRVALYALPPLAGQVSVPRELLERIEAMDCASGRCLAEELRALLATPSMEVSRDGS